MHPNVFFKVPNLAAALNARARLACYPRGNFYPVIKSATTRYLRVTMSYFRNCSTCQSYSKADLYHYALRLISIQPESTFEILRYTLVRNRPSQTTYLTLFSYRVTVEVRNKIIKGRCYIGDSTPTCIGVSKSPSYALHQQLYLNDKL